MQNGLYFISLSAQGWGRDTALNALALSRNQEINFFGPQYVSH